MKVWGQDLGELMDDSGIHEMSSASKEKTYNEGDIIMKQGEKATVVYFIKEGAVNFFSSKRGSIPIKQFTDGDYFGDISILNTGVTKATVIVATPKLECYMLERKEFLKVFEKIKYNLPAGIDIMQLLTHTFKPEPNAVKLKYVHLLSIQPIPLCY